MTGEDVPEDSKARQRREEGCRREEAIRGLLKRHGDKRLTIVDVEAVAWELGVSRSTTYRLIIAYRAKGTVSSVEPRAMGRRKDVFVLDAKDRMAFWVSFLPDAHRTPRPDGIWLHGIPYGPTRSLRKFDA
jgi:predicted ArsR family transcriptional regulator